MVHGLEGRRPAARSSGTPGRSRRVLTFQPIPARRLWLVYLLLAAGLGGLALRLAWVQLVQGNELLTRARAVQTQTISPLGRRRPIVDRQGRLVATTAQEGLIRRRPG